MTAVVTDFVGFQRDVTERLVGPLDRVLGHDLSNDPNVVLGYGELLREAGVADDERESYADRVVDTAAKPKLARPSDPDAAGTVATVRLPAVDGAVLVSRSGRTGDTESRVGERSRVEERNRSENGRRSSNAGAGRDGRERALPGQTTGRSSARGSSLPRVPRTRAHVLPTT